MSIYGAFRDEIEQILLIRSHIRAAKILRWEKRGLTNAEMSDEATAEGEPCNPESIASVRRILRLTLADDLVPAPSDSQEQAGTYRELLNNPYSPELRQHISTRLAELQQRDRDVKLTPLGHGYLGANQVPRTENWAPRCPECNLCHPGECW